MKKKSNGFDSLKDKRYNLSIKGNVVTGDKFVLKSKRLPKNIVFF